MIKLPEWQAANFDKLMLAKDETHTGIIMPGHVIWFDKAHWVWILIKSHSGEKMIKRPSGKVLLLEKKDLEEKPGQIPLNWYKYILKRLSGKKTF